QLSSSESRAKHSASVAGGPVRMSKVVPGGLSLASFSWKRSLGKPYGVLVGWPSVGALLRLVSGLSRHDKHRTFLSARRASASSSQSSGYSQTLAGIGLSEPE